MARSPRHINILTEHGVSRIAVRYIRPFTQTVTVQFCWLYKAGIDHDCDECGCWS